MYAALIRHVRGSVLFLFAHRRRRHCRTDVCQMGYLRRSGGLLLERIKPDYHYDHYYCF